MRTQWLTLAVDKSMLTTPVGLFSLYTVTKQTFWINIIIAIPSPLSVATSRGFLFTKKTSLVRLACLLFVSCSRDMKSEIPEEWVSSNCFG